MPGLRGLRFIGNGIGGINGIGAPFLGRGGKGGGGNNGIIGLRVPFLGLGGGGIIIGGCGFLPLRGGANCLIKPNGAKCNFLRFIIKQLLPKVLYNLLFIRGLLACRTCSCYVCLLFKPGKHLVYRITAFVKPGERADKCVEKAFIAVVNELCRFACFL